MPDPDPDKPPPSLDDPVVKARVVRVMVTAGPLMFVFSWLLAAFQGATSGLALLLAGITLGACLGTALSIQMLGSQSRHVLTAVIILLSLLSFCTGRR